MSDELRAKMKRTSPADAGLSPLDYHNQATSGVDPLHEFGDVGRDVVRVCAHRPGTHAVSDVVAVCDWGSKTSVREAADRLVRQGVLVTERVDDKLVEYDLADGFRETEVFEAHRQWREGADAEVTL